MVTAAATPLASLGPTLDALHQTPWARGIRLVDDQGTPYRADDIQIGAFYTALPERSDPEAFGAGLLVVRLPADFIHLPAARRDWAPSGILAYSKICPHAGCAISLYRYPTYAPTSQQPAFTCPCHYSTFLPGEGGRVTFGPAGRSLPQLPLMIDSRGLPARRRPVPRGHRALLVGRAPSGVMNLIERYAQRRFERAARSGDERLGMMGGIKWAMRYVFPDHWSFLLGEIALYSFIVLVGTGIFLTLYYIPGDDQVIYHGSYPLLHGEQMSEAYRSVLNLSTTVPAGLLFRQVHHWAADVFIAAIVLHLVRVFFTGAYRKPRDLNYFIGLTMLMLAILEGFAGYSLVDDLLSGMGLAIALLGRDVDPVHRRPARDADLGRPVPRERHVPAAPRDRARSADPGGAGRADQRCTWRSSCASTTPSSPVRAAASATSWAHRCGRPTLCVRSGCCSRSPACCSCSAASSRSTRSGSGGRTTRTCQRTAPSRTGTSAG